MKGGNDSDLKNQYRESLLLTESHNESTQFSLMIPKKKTTFESTSTHVVIKAKSVTKVGTIEEALELSGGFGKFQACQVVICCLTMIRCGLTYFPIPYLELFPPYECQMPSGNWESCSRELFCANSSIKHRVDFSSEKALVNWVG